MSEGISRNPEELTNEEKALNEAVGRESDEPSFAISQEEEAEKEREHFKTLFRRLHEREKTIINLRFGLNEDKKIHTLEETGKILGVTKETIRQLEYKALEKLGVHRLDFKNDFESWEKYLKSLYSRKTEKNYSDF